MWAGNPQGIPRPYEEVCQVETSFIIILIYCLSFLLSLTHECKMEFSNTDWMLQQIWESSCLSPTKPEIRDANFYKYIKQCHFPLFFVLENIVIFHKNKYLTRNELFAIFKRITWIYKSLLVFISNVEKNLSKYLSHIKQSSLGSSMLS